MKNFLIKKNPIEDYRNGHMLRSVGEFGTFLMSNVTDFAYELGTFISINYPNNS